MAESRYPAIGALVKDIVPSLASIVEYGIYWESPIRCHVYGVNLTSAVDASGIYGFATKSGGSCGEFSRDYPATGVRTRAPSQQAGSGQTWQGLTTGQQYEALDLLDGLSDMLNELEEEDLSFE